MEIKTKFNVGEGIIAILNGRFVKVYVESIHIHICRDEDTEISYDVIIENTTNRYSIGENNLFKDKEDVIKFIEEKL